MSLKEFANGKLSAYLLANINFEKVFCSSERIEAVLRELEELRGIVDSSEINANGSIPKWLTTKLFRLGVYSITLPLKRDGLEANMLDFVKIVYALAKVDASIAMSVIPHTGMGLGSILRYANDLQKETILQNLIPQEKIFAFAMSEAHTGSDLTGMYTVLKKDNEKKFFLLSGTKSWVTNGGVADAIIVCAKCPDLIDVPNASLFVYLKGDEQGLIKKDLQDKMGHRGAVTTDLYFQNIRVSSDRIIGVPGKGYEQFNGIVDSGRFGVAAASVGLVSKAAQITFNDKAVNSAIPDLVRSWVVSLIFQMKATVYLGAMAHDLNIKERSSITALVKVFCTTHALKIVNELQEYLLYANDQIIAMLEQLFGDVPIYRITEGPNEVIGYRCALDIVTSLSDISSSCDSVVPFLTPSLHASGAILDRSLSRFSELIRHVRLNHRPLTESQLALNRVLRVSTDLFVFLATLLYTNAFYKAANKSEQFNIGLQSSGYLAKKIERSMRATEFEEILNSDSAVSNLSEKIMENYRKEKLY
jgi:alkylation response protein AidB-like acyl-CoA dehydrogenase